jgi:hypothetical protein
MIECSNAQMSFATVILSEAKDLDNVARFRS